MVQAGGSQGVLCFQPQAITVGVWISAGGDQKKRVCTSNTAVEKKL